VKCLHGSVLHRGDSERAHFAVRLRDVDAPHHKGHKWNAEPNPDMDLVGAFTESALRIAVFEYTGILLSRNQDLAAINTSPAANRRMFKAKACSAASAKSPLASTTIARDAIQLRTTYRSKFFMSAIPSLKNG
jgi:hypothetical protein